MKESDAARPLSLFVSDVDYGGAAIACHRVYHELNRITGNRCCWAVASSKRQVGAIDVGMWPVFPALISYEIKRRLFKGARSVVKAEHVFCEKNLGHKISLMNPKALYLHNIHQKTSFRLLSSFPRDTPILISLQDMWYLTGYCCYSMECDKYVTGCQGDCPQWGKWEVPTCDASVEWRHRQQFYLDNAHRITVIAPSRWMAKCAEARFHGNINVEQISNPVDTSTFKPVGAKRQIRELLGFDADKPLILCGAVTIKDERKGASYLKEALDRLRRRLRAPFNVAVFGLGAEGGAVPGAVSLGAIHDERLLNLYYNAATVFVLPSLSESFGLVFAEAMAAGTPCVAFDTTACSELVREGETGYLAKLFDVNGLTSALERAIEAGDNNPLTQRSRAHAVAEYDVRVVGQQHLNLIKRVIGE